MNWKTKETEQKVPKFLRNGNGCEAVTNDGDVKVVVTHTTSFAGSMENDGYVATYYVKEGDGWLKTSTAKSYNSMESFIDDMRSAEEFTQAMNDYDEFNTVTNNNGV